MKKTNKGFSLVELIIVIAIMAILAGAIAPALIRYIDKSRRSNDVTAAKTIKTAVETALGTEDCYEYLTLVAAADTNKYTVITVASNKSTAATAITGIPSTKPAGYDGEMDDVQIGELIFDNIGEKTPKLKFKKSIDDYLSSIPTDFYVMINNKGTVSVYIGSSAPTGAITNGKASNEGDGTTAKDCVQVAPEVSKAYQ